MCLGRSPLHHLSLFAMPLAAEALLASVPAPARGDRDDRPGFWRAILNRRA